LTGRPSLVELFFVRRWPRHFLDRRGGKLDR
jgi:hypothetical protein